MTTETNLISFGQFLDRMGLYHVGMSFWMTDRNRCCQRQQWMQRQYSRFVDHTLKNKKERFVLEPYSRSKSKYDKMHFTQWNRSLAAKARKERW